MHASLAKTCKATWMRLDGARGAALCSQEYLQLFFIVFFCSMPACAQVQTVLVPPQRYSTCLLGCTHPCCLPPVLWYKATHTDHYTHSELNKTRPYRGENLASEPPWLKGSILGSSVSGPGRVSAPGLHVCPSTKGFHFNLLYMNIIFTAQHLKSHLWNWEL